MTIRHHPDHATLMAFAAGTLGEALSAVVATHAELCAGCRRELKRMDMIGAALLGGLEGSAVSAGGARTALGRREAHALRPPAVEGLPQPLARLLGRPLADVGWKRLGPGVRSAKLPLSKGAGGDLRLLRVAPGRAVPDHGHGGAELTLVLSGAYTDRLGRFGPGDVADLDEEVEHKPVADAGEDCICLVASERAIRLKGVLGRLLQPLVRM
jgi:putative transcriptional regulator